MATGDLEEITTLVREHVRRRVAAGFDSSAGVVQSVFDVFCDDASVEVLRPLAEQITREEVAAHLRAQRDWPSVTDCDRLDDAFAELTRSGIVCRQDFSCCGNCGVAEIGGEIETERQAGVPVRGYAFYHMQDTESAAGGYGLGLNYGALEKGEDAALTVGRKITETLERHGLKTDWNGRWDTRIGVQLDWKRRRPDEVRA